MNKTYLYPYSAKEARERNELSIWRESHRANIACRDAIEDAIRRGFAGMHLDKGCITPVQMCIRDSYQPMLSPMQETQKMEMKMK